MLLFKSTTSVNLISSMTEPPSSHANASSSRTRYRFFPKNWNDGSLLYFCIFLASLAGIIVVGLSLYKSNQAQKRAAVENEIHQNWAENLIPTQADLIDVLLQDVNSSRTLVIFENGSVVIVAEPDDDPKKTAIETLKTNASPDSIFAVNRVQQDYVIRFKGPIFTRISGDAVASEFTRIQKNWKQYLSTNELKNSEKNNQEPEITTQVGLVARSFLARDLEDLKVSKILKAESE